MTAQARRVLDHLTRVGSDTDSNMGRCLDCPAASVRRSIQELMREGHLISYSGHDHVYRMTQSLPFKTA